MTNKQHIDLRLLTFLKELHKLMDKYPVSFEYHETILNDGRIDIDLVRDKDRKYSGEMYVSLDHLFDASDLKRLLDNCEEWTEDSPS